MVRGVQREQWHICMLTVAGNWRLQNPGYGESCAAGAVAYMYVDCAVQAWKDRWPETGREGSHNASPP